jgi:hypothetical protein
VHDKPSRVAVLDTIRCTYAVPLSKALKNFVLPIHSLNGTHTQSMSQLSQGLKSFSNLSSHSSILVEVDLTSDINKGS